MENVLQQVRTRRACRSSRRWRGRGRQGPLDSTPKSDPAVERAVRARDSAADRPLSDGDYSRCKDNLR